jgi:hypothetical protein
MNKVQKRLTAVFLCCIAVLTTLGAISALSSWHMTITSTNLSKQFEVYHDSGLTQPWATPTSLELIIETYPNTTTIDFWIKNIGNVPIDSQNTTTTCINCTASWTLPTNIIPSTAGKATLVLTITGECLYAFDFTSIKHT